MADVQIGGDPSRYMQAPMISSGDSGGGAGSFIASLLSLLGVGIPVAAGGKSGAAKKSQPSETPTAPAEGSPPESKSTPAPRSRLIDVGATPFSLPVLDMASAAFTPSASLSSQSDTFGSRWLESLRPIPGHDPNTTR